LPIKKYERQSEKVVVRMSNVVLIDSCSVSMNATSGMKQGIDGNNTIYLNKVPIKFIANSPIL